ncbi:autotransporter-associated beta strand repeat-containing protein [Citrobacter amalonaticus]
MNHVGSGTTTLTGANTYQGSTHVANGTFPDYGSLSPP